VHRDAIVVKEKSMETSPNLVRIFVQGEGIRDIEQVEVSPSETFGALKAQLINRFGLDASVALFLEDADDPPDERKEVREHGKHVKVHVHRCTRVSVVVTFNRKHVEHTFPPSATVGRVKVWAAGKLGMTPEDATEHVLQISGTHDRPSPGAHLGSLVKCPRCEIKFDLVPEERVNGAPAGQG
jgi:hypothetical protein